MIDRVVRSVAEAVAFRSDEPLLMQPSPTKSPASRIAMIASFPCLLMTVTFTVPDSMNRTVLAASPCRNTLADFANCADVRATACISGPITGAAGCFAEVRDVMEHDTVAPGRVEVNQWQCTFRSQSATSPQWMPTNCFR